MTRPRIVTAVCAVLLLVPLVALAATREVEPRRFTLAVVPDTQYLFDDEQGRSDPEPLAESFAWIAEHAQARDIVFTASLGDIVEHATPQEFDVASPVYGLLDEAGLPYSTLAGNHDVDAGLVDTERPDSAYLEHFGPQRFKDQMTFRDADPTGYNTAHVFSGGGQEWLLLALDWRMSDQSFDWAQSTIDAHPTLPVILTTHELVYDGGEGVAELSEYGRQLWDRLIDGNDQVFLALGGHFWPTARTTMTNAAGNPVELDLANYQEQYYGGAGMIRLYTFDLDADEIDVATFSPWAAREWSDGNPLAHDVAHPTRAIPRATDQFTIGMDFEQRFAGFGAALTQPPEPVAVEEALVDGTVAYWRLGAGPQPGDPVAEEAVAIRDRSGRGNHLRRVTLPDGDAESLVYSADQDPDQPGRGSLRFDGSQADGMQRGAYLQTVDDAPINDDRFRDGYTVEAFLKLPADCCGDAHAWMGVLSRLGTGGDVGKLEGFSPDQPVATFSVSPSRQLQWEMFPADTDATRTNWSHELEPAVWRHVAIVNDGEQTTMYIDGAEILRNPEARSVGVATAGRPWLVGASHWDNAVGQSFYGWIGDVRIADRPLDADEWLPVGRP